MFDFKYHIVSLVAVFLALGIGVVMGSMTAEQGVVTNQEKSLIATMEKDFERLRSDNAALSTQISADTKFADSALSLMVTDKLKGKTVAVVVTGAIDTPDLKNLKAALEKAGGIESSVTTFTGGIGLDTKDAPKQLDEAARWIASGANPKGVSDLAATGFMKVSGVYNAPVQGVIVIGGTDNDKAPKFINLDAPIIKSFLNMAVTVVGAESSTVKNSAIRDFQALGISTVDDIETTPGWISLIYVLGGQAGDFGAKVTADTLMPLPAKS